MKSSTLIFAIAGAAGGLGIYYWIKRKRGMEEAAKTAYDAALASGKGVSAAIKAAEQAAALKAAEEMRAEELKKPPTPSGIPASTLLLAESGVKLSYPDIPKGFKQYIMLNRVSSLSDEAAIAKAESDAALLWQEKEWRLQMWPQIKAKGSFYDKFREMFWKWDSVNQVWRPYTEREKTQLVTTITPQIQVPTNMATQIW